MLVELAPELVQRNGRRGFDAARQARRARRLQAEAEAEAERAWLRGGDQAEAAAASAGAARSAGRAMAELGGAEAAARQGLLAYGSEASAALAIDDDADDDADGADDDDDDDDDNDDDDDETYMDALTEQAALSAIDAEYDEAAEITRMSKSELREELRLHGLRFAGSKVRGAPADAPSGAARAARALTG
jgi:hypothetical protein